MQIIDIIEARRLLEKFADKDINAHLSYWMTKFIFKTQNEHEFYVKNVQKIIDKYADSQEDNGNMRIPADKIKDFNDEIDELNKTDVEAPNIKFSLSEIASELKLSMKDISLILEFIDEEK